MAPENRRNLTLSPEASQVDEIGRWLSAFQDSRSRTFEILEEITQDEIDWDPGDGGSRIATLLYHVAAIEMDWLFEEVLVAPFPPKIEEMFTIDIRERDGRLSQVEGFSLENHLERLAYVRELLIQAYGEMNLQEFRRPRQLERYDVSPEWVLHHLMQHEAEHRSEIGALRIRAKAALGIGG